MKIILLVPVHRKSELYLLPTDYKTLVLYYLPWVILNLGLRKGVHEWDLHRSGDDKTLRLFSRRVLAKSSLNQVMILNPLN
ncbi:hypothetical protein SAMN02745215_00748 [Desulfitobacterium chlororespirans DSM 11544]|uniref:Uncharacterized protein n=1 Tax=Desulfitobacterium chlororespirans DSM 11544 TaxID=1121395 RepID=A0A1M7SEU2_9FIRM|nr:hypothetical protein SAMN02745215_00748 [Desulfitobacterium chlororespirans DSM 11544]